MKAEFAGFVNIREHVMVSQPFTNIREHVFAGGEVEYKKAFTLDPNDATAHLWYGIDIGWIGGREQEAIAEVNRAHQLDPLSPIIGTRIGSLHIWARQYDEGIAACK